MPIHHNCYTEMNCKMNSKLKKGKNIMAKKGTPLYRGEEYLKSECCDELFWFINLYFRLFNIVIYVIFQSKKLPKATLWLQSTREPSTHALMPGKNTQGFECLHLSQAILTVLIDCQFHLNVQAQLLIITTSSATKRPAQMLHTLSLFIAQKNLIHFLCLLRSVCCESCHNP